MKIETLTINFAVADRISRDNINELLAEFVASAQNIGFYGIEIEDDGKHTTTSAADVPRKKRKYTRHVKPTEGDSKRTTTSSPAEGGVKVTRRKMADGTTIENRGNCQGGGAV